ncbi:MAG: hypothetical protein OEV41_02730, partial [Gammaproteobacteria bacterium]|nr:hypothetical protein [Gammaproteobacteria bacterium]
MLAMTSAGAEGYVLGAGAEADTAEGRAVTAFADLSVTERTWLSFVGAMAQTEGVLRDSETRLLDVSIDHSFEPIGIRIGGGYWGDPDILDSRDLNASVYLRGGTGSISVDYEKRNFEFDLQSDLLRGNTVKWTA